MTKIYVAIEDSDTTEQDVVNNILDNSFFVGESIDDLVAAIDDDGNSHEGMDVYVFEIVDKGTIKSKHSFVSSKKVK